MKIFVLEDDLIQQMRLEDLIKKIIIKNGFAVAGVASFGKPELLMVALDGIGQNNIYFLDINIKGESKKGLEIAEEIRRLDPIGQISFVTTHTEFAAITYSYKVSAYDFIDKILPPAEFEQKIEDNIAYYFERFKLKKNDEIFSYQSTTGKLIEGIYADILYFETTGFSHKILLQMDHETINFYGNMSDIETMSDKFVRVHKSFIVNRNRIKEIIKKDNKVILDNGEEIPMSRTGLKLLAP